MELKWTSRAQGDLARLYAFLERSDPKAAARALRALVAAPARLRELPRIGEPLAEFEPREVRRILIGRYELRYEVRRGAVFVLRVWHTRENR